MMNTQIENWKEKYLNRITQGDCLTLMKEIPSHSIDLIITDPPYNTGLEADERNHRLRSFFNDNMPPEKFELFLNEFFKQCYGVLKTNKLIYCFIDFRSFALVKQYLEKNDFNNGKEFFYFEFCVGCYHARKTIVEEIFLELEKRGLKIWDDGMAKGYYFQLTKKDFDRLKNIFFTK